MTRKRTPSVPVVIDDATNNPMAREAARSVVPAVPLIERDASNKLGTVRITPAGLEHIRLRAGDGASQNLIASELGITKSTLRAVFERQDEARVAYEHGVALEEMELVESLKKAAANGYSPAAMFLLKTRHQYSEGAPQADTKPNVTIVLPDAYSPQDYIRVINEQPRPSGKQLEAIR